MVCWTLDDERQAKEFFANRMTDEEVAKLLEKPIASVRMRRFHFESRKGGKVRAFSDTQRVTPAKSKAAQSQAQEKPEDGNKSTGAAGGSMPVLSLASLSTGKEASGIIDRAIDSLLRRGIDPVIVASSFLMPLEEIQMKALVISEEVLGGFDLP